MNLCDLFEIWGFFTFAEIQHNLFRLVNVFRMVEKILIYYVYKKSFNVRKLLCAKNVSLPG